MSLYRGVGFLKTNFVTVPRTSYVELGGVRNGANLKEIKNRIKSVKAIQKITKTMKMIASARLRGAQNRMEEARPFASASTKTLSGIKGLEVTGANSQSLVITISTDRGLCGSINSQIVRATRALLEDNSKGKSVLALLGDKATSQMARNYADAIRYTVHDLSKGGNNFFAMSVTVDKILSNPELADIDNIYVLFNKFNSVISFTPVVRHIPTTKVLRKKVEEAMAELDDFEFEDDFKTDHLCDLGQYHLAATVYSALLENQASELGARMTSMDTATTNAGDMIKRLTIRYNRGRQAAITTELNEIISGAEALKGTGNKDSSDYVVPIDSIEEVLAMLKQKGKH